MTESEFRIPRLGALYTAGFVTAFGAHSIAAGVGADTTNLGLTVLGLGVLLAVYDIAEVILKPLFGTLSDRIGPKPVIIGGLLLFAAASAAGIWAHGIAALAIIRLAQGAGASAFSPSSSAAVARLTPKNRVGRYFGRYGSWKGLGYAGGPVLGALLITSGGLPLLFGILPCSPPRQPSGSASAFRPSRRNREHAPQSSTSAGN